MVNAIVFSMNRAMQLDLCMRSMKRYAAHLYPPIVMRRATAAACEWGYGGVRAEHGGLVWTDQEDFKRKLIGLIRGPQTMLLVDDDVFFRRLPEIEEVKPGTCYSIRLEDETGYALTPSLSGRGGYSVDGNIHRSEELRAALEAIEFSDPCKMEEQLNWNPSVRPVVEVHGARRCLVNIPHNKVQTIFPANPSMGGSAEELNERYLAGERIDLDAMDFSNVTGPHAFLPYVFRRSDA